MALAARQSAAIPGTSAGEVCMENHDSRLPWFTRRALLGTAAGAALGAYGLSLGLAAEVPDVFDGTQFKIRAPEPNAKRGGVLRYGVLSAPAHFDVHQSGTVSNIGTQGCMYDNLIRRDPRDSGQTIIPDLAHSWEIAKDGKTYTFFLRKGVKFHDGGDFTAEDVKATYARLITPPTGFSSPRTPLFAAVSEINVRDPHTIEFQTERGTPEEFYAGGVCQWLEHHCAQEDVRGQQLQPAPGDGLSGHRPVPA